MRSIEMILMTRSSKYGGYCVAGFDCSSGQWVRLTSKDETSDGALNDEMLFDARKRRCADVLDWVRVDIEEDIPGVVQVENVLIDRKDRIRILKKAKLAEALALHPCETWDGLFGSYYHMVQVDVRTLHHSLEMVRAEKVHVYTAVGSSGKLKYKMDFEYGGQKYTQFAMTDPAYYDCGEVRIGEAVVVLSISDNEWSRKNGNYIYAAKIFKVKGRQLRTNVRIGLKKAGILIAGAAVLAAGMWLASKDTVFVTRHTGSRYHRSIECEQLLNPNAAVEIPTIVGKIFFKECGSCCE